MKLLANTNACQVFETLLSRSDLRTVIDANDHPAQLTLNDLGVPVLDRTYPILSEDVQVEDSGDEDALNDWAAEAEIAKVSAILADNLNKVFSPPNAYGQRRLLPRNLLKSNKILKNKRIIEVGTSLKAAKELIEYGASVMVVSPYSGREMLEDLEIKLTLETRAALLNCCKQMDSTRELADVVAYFTGNNNPINYLTIDRDGLLFHFIESDEVDDNLTTDDKRVEDIFRAVDYEKYTNIGQFYGHLDKWKLPDSEIFKFSGKEKLRESGVRSIQSA